MNIALRAFLLTCVLALPTACYSTPGTDQTPLLQRLEQEILGQPVAGKLVYLFRQPLRGGDVISAWRFQHSVPQGFGATTFVFVDEQPGANWEHAARYVFIDQASGRFRVEPGRTPPDKLTSMQRLN